MDIQSKEREEVKDPPIPKKVGRPRTKRLVSAAEQTQNKARKKGPSGKGKGNEDDQPRKGRRILVIMHFILFNLIPFGNFFNLFLRFLFWVVRTLSN